jgi:hypoxanthine phosphoribosyltransferase
MQTSKLTWQQFEAAIDILEDCIGPRISKHHLTSVYGIPRGGLILAVCLSHRLKLPLTDSVQSSTLVVDDIADTGKTLGYYKGNITATIHYVKESLFIPSFTVYEKKRGDWIVYPWEDGKNER